MAPMDDQLDFDAIVIGAGVIGSSVALELTRKGLRVACVDKLSSAGSGSTSSSSSVIRFNYSTAGGVAMAWEGLHYWQDWPSHIGPVEGPVAEFIRKGMLLLKCEGTNEAHFLPLYKRFGIAHEELSAGEVEERYPWIDMNRYGPPRGINDPEFFGDARGVLEGASLTPDGGFINDPMLAAQNLADAAQREGAQFFFGRRVVAIPRSGNRVEGVQLADGTVLNAPVVVNVAGPHSFAINTMAGVVESMGVVPKPMRREVHMIPGPADVDYEADGVLFADIDVGTYTRPERGNNILIGGVEPQCDPLEWVDDPDAVSLVVDSDEFELQALRAARRVRGVGVPPAKKGVVGVYDASPDWTPIYDRSDLDGFYMAIGTSGNQFKNAAVAGRCMAELITAVEAGHDHDHDPLVVTGHYTGNPIDLGTFTRNRITDGSGPSNVLG